MAPSPPRRMSSQSLSTNDEDRRFANLLKPIKDLTANWKVPLADYLQDYYQEITEIQINLDGRTTRINFAEAALFLQGTASVYSKKVEFLWQTVLSMLDTLSSKRALEEASAEAGGSVAKKSRKGAQAAAYDLANFCLIPLELSRNADMKPETDMKKDVHSRKLTLKFIFVTPRQLIEKEGKEVKEARVNLYAPSAGSKYDLIGHKEDFRVNMQFSLSTGMIGDDLCQELEQQSVSLCEESNFIPEATLAHSANPDNVQADLGDPMDDQDDADCDPPEIDVQEEVLQTSDVVEECMEKPKKRDRLAEICNEPKAPLADPWEPLTPQEEAATAPKRKPIKKGRTTKPPPKPLIADPKKKTRKDRSRKVEAGCKRLKVTVPVELFLIQEFSGGRYSASDFHGGKDMKVKEPPEFKDLKRRKRIAEIDSLSPPEIPVATEPEETDQDDAPAAPDFDDIPDPQDFAVEPSTPTTPPPEPVGDEIDEDSYEQLVVKRVASYVAQSQDYVKSTDLAKRVAKWHESIGPRLEAVERRGNFDIHSYGSRILNSFASDTDATVSFVELSSKQESKEEVARLFLSALMLANTYNVDLRSKTNKPLAMDDAELKLLTTTRHHENMFDKEEAKSTSKKMRKKA